MAPVDDSSTKQSANGSLAITFLLSCLRLQSEDSTVKQRQHSTVCVRPGGHNGHHVALDNLWPSHGRTQRKIALKARENPRAWDKGEAVSQEKAPAPKLCPEGTPEFIA